ncbi:MAG TPA: hypothetical protein VID50_01615 [Candidatus Eisenbacteria bacterium]|jgi:hypothetical protein
MSRMGSSLAVAALAWLLTSGCASSHREPESGSDEAHLHFGDRMERLGRWGRSPLRRT